MTAFRAFLAIFLLALVTYTLLVSTNHGMNLFPIFFGDMQAMTWPGQFNFDFMGFLMLSAIWVVWRNQFTPISFAIGCLAAIGGMLFLTIYLLYLSFQTNGDVGRMILGNRHSRS